jgi:peptidoglycan/LPS O-acetylase OafA/YrhL
MSQSSSIKTPQQRKMPRYPELDGWRGLSILFVMAGHLLPLGPQVLDLNAATAALGMVLFFTLSGFLITATLIYRPSVRDFLIRRIMRIVPLAWLFSLVVLLSIRAPLSYLPAQLFFYSNLPPFRFTLETAHLWSLCVEMQFYLTVAVIFALFRRRGLYLLPVLCVTVTLIRIFTHTTISIVTYKRVDEILAGATLALIYENMFGRKPRSLLARVNPYFLLPVLYLSCLDASGPLNYLRPYLASALVGSTLLRPDMSLSAGLRKRWLAYLANISYALYVLHPISHFGFMESGTKVMKYMKRIPSVTLVFVMAHLSTKYYEAYWINLGRRLTGDSGSRRPPSPPSVPKHENVALASDSC